MNVSISCVKHYKEIQEQLDMDVDNLGFNYDLLVLEWLKESFEMEEPDSLVLR